MKRLTAILLLIIAMLSVNAQLPGAMKGKSTATWTSKIEMTGAKTGRIILTLTPASGWHIYGFEVENGGPKPMIADFNKSTGIKFKGDWKYSVAPVKEFDELFGIEVTYWKTRVVLSRDFEASDISNAKIVGTISYQGCNGETCNPPQKYNVSLTLPSKK